MIFKIRLKLLDPIRKEKQINHIYRKLIILILKLFTHLNSCYTLLSLENTYNIPLKFTFYTNNNNEI